MMTTIYELDHEWTNPCYDKRYWDGTASVKTLPPATRLAVRTTESGYPFVTPIGDFRGALFTGKLAENILMNAHQSEPHTWEEYAIAECGSTPTDWLARRTLKILWENAKNVPAYRQWLIAATMAADAEDSPAMTDAEMDQMAAYFAAEGHDVFGSDDQDQAEGGGRQ